MLSIDDTINKIDELLQHEASQITHQSVENAKWFVNRLFRDVTAANIVWVDPFVCDDEESVSLEWHLNTKGLFFDIESNIIKYTKIWLDGKHTLTDTKVLDDNDLALWYWFVNGERNG